MVDNVADQQVMLPIDTVKLLQAGNWIRVTGSFWLRERSSEIPNSLLLQVPFLG